MSKNNIHKEFLKRIRKGRKFEKWERSYWNSKLNSAAEFEASTDWQGKHGRVDIRLGLDKDGQVVIVEIKATDWDKIKEDRVRQNAMRHAHQIWRYIDAHLNPSDVVPAIVYPAPPKTPARKEQVEEILNERGIQVVWREEYSL